MPYLLKVCLSAYKLVVTPKLISTFARQTKSLKLAFPYSLRQRKSTTTRSERIHFHEFVSSAVPGIHYVNWLVNAIDESVTHGNRSLNRNLE